MHPVDSPATPRTSHVPYALDHRRTVYSDRVSPFQYWIVVGLITGFSLIPRLWNLANTTLWTDEMLTFQRVQAPLGASLASILSVGNQTPLYYLVLHLLPQVSPLWLRLPSVAFGILGIVLLYHMIAILYDDKVWALQAAALVAANPLHIILSRTARYYTILMALAVLNVFCFVLLLRGRRSRGLWLTFVLSSMLAYLIHYTALALPVAQGAALLIGGRRQRTLLWRWCLAQVAAVAPLVIWLLLTLNTFSASGYDYLGQPLSWRDLPVSWLNLAMGFDGQWNWALMPGLVCAAIGVLTGIIFAWSERRHHEEFTVWLLLAIMPVVVLFMMSILAGVQYRDRYFLVGMPSVILLTVWGGQRYAYLLRWAGFIIILVTSIYLVWQIFDTGAYQRSDWRAAADYVADHYQPGDIVLFERSVIAESFSFYSEEHPELLESYAVLFDAVDPVAFEPQAQRIWVIYQMRHEDLHRQGWSRAADPFVPRLCPISDWLIARRARIQKTVQFEGLFIFLVKG